MLRRILQFEAKQQAPTIAKALEAGPALQKKSPPKAANANTPVNSSKGLPAPPPKKETAPVIVSNTTTITAGPTAESPFRKILDIISEESGIDVNDFGDDTMWTEIGVDSLLSLQITGRIREEIEVDMDLDDLLVRFATVNELRNFFGSEINAAQPKVEITQTSIERAVKAPAPAPTSSEKRPDLPAQDDTSVFRETLAIISDVTGIGEEELTDEAIFADIGVDSLMSLMLTSRLRDELEMEIEDDNFWARFHTVGDLRDFLSESSKSEETPTLSRSTSTDDTGITTPITPDVVLTERSVTIKTIRDPSSVPSASSVVLQGSPKRARTMLFLFPDGAGSATSYSSIPAVAPDVAVIGLNSPYYKDPANFKCNIDDLIDAYLDEVRRRQPMGPYHFAGWSAGGMLAYHATYRMIMSGEEMEHLILIDSPVPKGLDHLPQHFYDFLSKHQLFGHATNAGTAAPPPDWLFPHFNATIDALHDFIARPLPEGTAPRTCLIWAGEGVLNGLRVELPPHPDDTEGMKFLTTKHASFSGNGWEELFPGEKLQISVAEGANHFSMMVSSCWNSSRLRSRLLTLWNSEMAMPPSLPGSFSRRLVSRSRFGGLSSRMILGGQFSAPYFQYERNMVGIVQRESKESSPEMAFRMYQSSASGGTSTITIMSVHPVPPCSKLRPSIVIDTNRPPHSAQMATCITRSRLRRRG